MTQVNYYPRHIGDYVSATAHLSMLEDGAYNRLLDWYYQDEKPLPSDKRLIYRRVRAAGKPEREAVDSVLDEFFVLAEDGYRHLRCDAEIEKNNDRATKARKSAEMRWQSERNANASADAMRTHSERNATHGRGHAPDQKPKAKSQYSEQSSSSVSPEPKPRRPGRRCPADFEVTAELRAWAAEKAPGIDVDRETEALRDWEFRTPRSDWPATWRGWMRKASESRAGGRPVSGSDQDPKPWDGAI